MRRGPVGLLHPGEMGSVLGAMLRGGGGRGVWASEGRSGPSHDRATRAGVEDVGTLPALVRESAAILAVCPPHAALAVAREVARHQCSGRYLDGNAIAPETARAVGRVVEAAGASFGDGGIVGPPPKAPGTTRRYVSGPKATAVAAWFAASPLEAVVLDGPAGAASALKVAYAADPKGTAALLLAIRALAVTAGVDKALAREWERSQPDLPARLAAAVRGSVPKAWRFVGEMEERAATFAAAGLPDGFSSAAARVYRRLERYKDTTQPPAEAEIAAALRRG